MSAPTGRPASGEQIPMTVIPETGWHVGHYLYRFRRESIADGLLPGMCKQFKEALEPHDEDAQPARLSSYWISGHRADFAVVAMDPDPAKVDGVHQALMAPALGRVLEPVWSFISMTEISEYVPSLEKFREDLIVSGMLPESDELQQRVDAYAKRLPMMNEQRLHPPFPDWPAACFYPMNKIREVGANWFLEPFSSRKAMMAEHAKSGMAFAGRVSQLVSVGVGLDDWEWMVTLWAKNPQYLKDIVYQMRFDRASAEFAEFGPFYVGYRADAETIAKHCRLWQD
ncbi:MAG: hydrogen peroxide-dependent heme synthase [Planctomycetota bacterium]